VGPYLKGAGLEGARSLAAATGQSPSTPKPDPWRQTLNSFPSHCCSTKGLEQREELTPQTHFNWRATVLWLLISFPASVSELTSLTIFQYSKLRANERYHNQN